MRTGKINNPHSKLLQGMYKMFSLLLSCVEFTDRQAISSIAVKILSEKVCPFQGYTPRKGRFCVSLPHDIRLNLSRAFQVTRLERTSVLFWCFVFLSSRCLIYKVHAASQRAFILPHSVELVKRFFQLLSKLLSALGSFASCANSFILPDFRALVKNFFRGFPILS